MDTFLGVRAHRGGATQKENEPTQKKCKPARYIYIYTYCTSRLAFVRVYASVEI